MDEFQSDVTIIGAGIAGLVATYECLNNKLSVNLIDRDTEENIGGLAKWAFGGMTLINTPMQARMGIHDNVKIAKADWYSFAKFNDNDEWPKAWADFYIQQSCVEIYDYLRGLGLKFLPAVNWVERGLQGDGNNLPRYHVLWGTGKRLVDRFVELIHSHPNRDLLNTFFEYKVEALSVQQGKLETCRAVHEPSQRQLTFKARHTIVATGGITGSLKQVRKHWYQPWGEAPEEILNGSHPYADGLLHDSLADQGASVTHLDKMWNYAAGIPHPKPKFTGHGLSLIPCKSALWLDADGKRIGPDPLVTGFDTNDLCRRVSQLPDPYTWQIMNWRIAAKEFAISGSEHNPSIRDRKTLRFAKEILLGNHALIRQIAEESDHFIVADTLEELVQKMNDLNGNSRLDLNSVKQEIINYDEKILRGTAFWNDDQVRRIQQARAWRSDKLRTCKPHALLEKSAGPLIAIKLRLISRKSLGGIQTNLQSQVLQSNGQAISGLYAIGEAAGFGGGGASGFKSLEGTFLSGCILTAKTAAKHIHQESKRI